MAGNGTDGFAGDGGPSQQAIVNFFTYGIEIGPEGSAYFADHSNCRVRRIAPGGIINTIVGNGTCAFSGDGQAATATGITPFSLALAPDGSIYISDRDANRVVRVAAPFPGFTATDIAVASEDGSELYRFDQNGRHLSTRDALTGATLLSFGYDPAGRLVTVTDADNNVTTIERDGSGLPLAIAAPFGQHTTLGLDAAGFLAMATNDAGERVRFWHQPSGLLDSLADPRGYVHRFAYDSLGRLVRDDDPAGGFKTLALTESDSSLTIPVPTALGRITTYHIERSNNGSLRRRITDPAGQVTTSTRSPDGRTTTTFATGMTLGVRRATGPRFGPQAPVLDSVRLASPGGLVAIMRARSRAVLSNPGDPLSLVTKTDSVSLNGQWTVSSYTAATRAMVQTSPQGRQLSGRLDAKGRLEQAQVAGLDSATFSYDAQGRLSQEKVGGRTWTYSYDTRGRLLSTQDPIGRRDSLFYDQADRLIRRVLPGGRELAFSYDSSGNLISVTPPGRTPHTFTYTAVDQAGSATPPNVGLTTPGTGYTYNADGQLTRLLRPDSVEVVLGYDPAGRPSTVTFDRGQLGFTYSPTTGLLTQLTAPGSNTLAFTYDGALPKTATWSGAVAGSVGVTYNADFRVASQTVNGAGAVSFGYDGDGLVTLAGALGLKRHAQHGLLERDSVGGVLGVWGYDGHGALASYTATHNASPLFATTYARDSLGRITSLTETVQGVSTTLAYSYDPAGRLWEVRRNGVLTATYLYDLNGNRTSVTTPTGTVLSATDAQDRLTSAGSATFGYTSNGELRTRVTGTDTTRCIYDALGNLTQVRLPTGTLIDYVIDAQNRRIGKKVNGVLTQGFLYQSQLAPVAELDGTGAAVSRFVYATRVNVPDYVVKGGQTYRLLLDHLGSVRLVVNTVDGTVAQRLAYDEYGSVTENTAPGFQPFGYAGGLQDDATGLVRFGARDYDPTIGRWTAKDPSGFGGESANLYSYATNDPISYVDAGGRIPILAVALAAWALYEAASSAYDVYNAANTWADPCASLGAKFGTTGLAVLGLVAPGGGGTALTRPVVANRKLSNITKNLYKGIDNPNRIGNGTTMDAIRHESITNTPVGGRWHTQKGEESINALNNWLDANPGASFHDRLVAQSVLDDLLSAFGR